MNSRSEQTENSLSVAARGDKSYGNWLLLAILALALGLRLWGIGFGLPYELTNDESKEIHRALKLGAGEYYWDGFGKGGLYYILVVEYGFLYGFWWITGRVAGTHDFALQLIRDPTALFLLGRLTVAIMGVLTCLVVFYVGKRVYDWRVGLGAAFIGATAYKHAAHSHIINVDIGMVLAVWASILAYLEYEIKADRRWLIGAGVLAGVAIAFKLPGAIVVPALLLAIGSRSNGWPHPRQALIEAGVVVLATLVTLTIVAPEWVLNVHAVLRPYVWILHRDTNVSGAFEGSMKEAFRLVTTRPGVDWTGFLRDLFEDHNLLLTAAAVIGLGLGVIRRHRWSMIWGVVIIGFVAIMSAADQGQPEHYLLPIVPCLWLLSAYAIVALAGRRTSLAAAGLVCVVAVPLCALARTNYEWTRPDTRVVAKEWIEANVPSGAKILMDGYQNRFTPSPPLTPDRSSVLRQIAGVASEPDRFRGVSQRTLKLYAEAMKSVEGPAYELHSTVWGLAVEEPTYYVKRCFEHVITSSYISRRYVGEINRQRFPKSAAFYEQLNKHPGFRKIYSIDPVSWHRSGPSIAVYKINSNCATSSSKSSVPQNSRFPHSEP